MELAQAVPLGLQPGRYLRVLKPFVDRDGPEVALAHWRTFLEYARFFHDDGRQVTDPLPVSVLRPERFRDSYADWVPPRIGAAS